MPQQCQVCSHPETHEIDKQLVEGKACAQIAAQYDGLDYQNVWRHGQNHLPAKLVKSFQNKEKNQAKSILNGIEDLLNETEAILTEARSKGQNRLALDAIREGRSSYELLSKIAVKLREFQQVEADKKSNKLNEQTSKGLQALSTPELKTLMQLMSKVKAQDEDYVLDRDSRIFVDSMTRMNSYSKNNTKNNKETFDPDSLQTPSTEPKNTKNNKSKLNESLVETKSNDNDPLQIDDLADFDLDDLSDSRSNVIPSEETDPPWRK